MTSHSSFADLREHLLNKKVEVSFANSSLWGVLVEMTTFYVVIETRDSLTICTWATIQGITVGKNERE